MDYMTEKEFEEWIKSLSKEDRERLIKEVDDYLKKQRVRGNLQS